MPEESIQNSKNKKDQLILLVAADAFSAQVFARTLKGFKFTILTDLAQLNVVVKNTYPCAVVVDENLSTNPFVRSFIAKPPYDVPVLIFPLPISRQKGTSNLPQGVIDYLVKPVPRAVLLDVVKKLDLKIKTILVVDDDPSMSRFVIQALRSSGEDDVETKEEYKILTALDGQEALRFLHTIPVGTIFLDLELTDMHGLTLLQRIQQDKDLPFMPVVIISASDPPPTFNPPRQGLYQVLVNRQFEPSEITDLVNTTLQQVSPRYAAENPAASQTQSDTSNPTAGE